MRITTIKVDNDERDLITILLFLVSKIIVILINTNSVMLTTRY